MGKRNIVNNRVPCDGCYVCCQNDLVLIHPELGDKASHYETEVEAGHYVLAHQDNGDCVYLDRATGCTIHERRPATCRELDCALFLLWPMELVTLLVARGEINPAFIGAARRRLDRAEDKLALFERLASHMIDKTEDRG